MNSVTNKEDIMYIAIDLGGTNIKGGIVRENGEIVLKDMIPTNAGRHYSEIIKDIAKLINKMLSDAGENIAKVKSIGVGIPGTCDAKEGVVIYASNINFVNVPVADELHKYFDVPVFIENDANCAALGEYTVLDEEIDNMVFVTLGTGVGGGIIIDKKLYTGKNGTAAEIGHMAINSEGTVCSCGARGCYETYASVTALIRQTKEFIENNPGSEFSKSVSGCEITGRTAFEAAKRGDADAKSIVDKWILYVATGIVNIINLLQPEVLIIGGAISKEGNYLLNPIIEYQMDNAYSKIKNPTRIMTAKLGNDAGLIGSAFLGKGVE